MICPTITTYIALLSSTCPRCHFCQVWCLLTQCVFAGQGQLMHIHKTLDSIQRRSAQRSQQRRLEQEQTHAADMDTISLRAQVNARCGLHAHVGHMFCAQQSSLLVKVPLSRTVCLDSISSGRAIYQTAHHRKKHSGMVCAVWSVRWSSLQPCRAHGAGQKGQCTADAPASAD